MPGSTVKQCELETGGDDCWYTWLVSDANLSHRQTECEYDPGTVPLDTAQARRACHSLCRTSPGACWLVRMTHQRLKVRPLTSSLCQYRQPNENSNASPTVKCSIWVRSLDDPMDKLPICLPFRCQSHQFWQCHSSPVGDVIKPLSSLPTLSSFTGMHPSARSICREWMYGVKDV